MKKLQHIFLTLTLLATLGVGNAWGYNEYGKQYLYFNGSAFTAFFNDGCKPYISANWAYDCSNGDNNGGDKQMTQIGSSYYYYLDLSTASASYSSFRAFYIGRSSSFYNGSCMGNVDGSTNNCIKATGWGTYTWEKYSPPMSSATVTSTSTVYGGDGTSGNPYQIKKGTTLSVSASATSSVSGDNQSKYYKFYKKEGAGSSSAWGSESTINTASVTASSTVGVTYEIYVEARNEYYGTYGTKATSSKIYFITVDPIYAILGDFNSWTHSAATWDLSDQGSNNWDATFALAANTTYEFKVVYNSVYYGKGTSSYTTVTRDAYTVSSLATGESIKNLKITTDVAGDYTFRFNSSSKNLIVTYPTAYTVTYGKGTGGSTVGASATSAGGSFSSGALVRSGDVVTFSQTASTGYTFKGWYTTSSGSTSAGVNGSNQLTINGNKTVYAQYTENSYTVTVTKNPSAGGSVTPTSATSMGQVTGGSITATYNPGYSFTNWTITSGTGYFGSSGTSTSTTTANTKFRPAAAATIRANFTANNYTITLNKHNGQSNGSINVTFDATTNLTGTAATPPSKTGYIFGGYYTGENGTGTKVINADGSVVSNASDASYSYTSSGAWKYPNHITLHASWTAKQTTISFSQSGTGYGSGGQTANKTATYGSAMPTTISVPTAANGYAFMGYYDALEPLGTQYYTSTGASARTWNKTSNTTTLYAYFKKADITDITLNQEAFVPVDAGAAATYVQANPTISPTPVEPTIVCWELLYNNDNPVPDKDPIADTGGGSYPRRVKFSINGLAAGTYKIKATLRTGSSCPDGGTILSVYTKNFRIASSHTLDIQYICDDEILSTGTVDVPALGTQSTTAPTHTTDVNSPFFGYSFHHWELPDGVTCTSGNTGNANTKGDLTISVSASYAGTIKVHYTHRGIVFYKKPGDWSSFANVYYYKISGTDKWHESEGDYKYRGLYTTGISAYQMTRIGTSSIYYYDYEGTATTNDDPGEYVAFTNESKGNQSPLYYCSASWPSKYTKGFSTGTPMFVAANYISEAYNSVNYYNRGHWTKYHRDWSEDDYTGYTLKIYNQKGAGRVELKSIPFTSNSEDLAYKAVVELEAGQTYGYKFVRDNNIWYKNDNDNTMDYTHRSNWIFEHDGSDGTACGITTTATGNYTFTLTLDQTDGKLRISVDYPIANNDYRLIYKDDQHTKWHPSATIAKQNNHKDTVSFFVRKNQSPIVKIQKATVNGSTGAVTWADYNGGTNLLATIPSVISSQTDTMVFNFNMKTDGSGAMTLESINPYRGDFYIRVDAANNKWDSYKAADHLMTYTEFSENRSTNTHGDLYSHYFCAWCPRGRNVKFTIANDYSPCISDTLIQDATFNNIDANGNLKSAGGDETSDRYSANIRFMWNRKTNYIGRAYVASSTNTAKRFLVLVCKDAYMHDADNNAISATANLEANAVLLQDDQNWIYETIVKVRPTARVRLYASYAQASPSANGAQYFRGSYNASFTDANTIQLLGGSGSQYYLMRVIYDFKTNRLITAWLPDGTDIEGNPLNIDADVMVIRDHQQAAEAITFHSASDKLGQVKTVYGTMRFNRWTLNNRARGIGGVEDFDKDHCSTTEQISTYHPLLDEGDQLSSFERNTYFISFPFDVQLNEVFGFGNYGEHWIISKYNGLRRAQVGYFYDNCINGDFDCTNWDFIWDRSGVTLNAYEGYLLSLDLDKMKYDDTTKFWLKQIQQVELYFPSKVPMSTITTTNVEMPALGTEYQCTKNFNTEGNNPEGDRRVKDSYWRCIGVPSYATYGTVLKDGDGNNISWQKNYSWDVNPNNLPFLYEWNTTDNTLTPQVTSTYSFKPLHSYLVQCKSKIKWTAVSATPASIVRRQRAETQHDYTWRLNLAGDNNDESDTYIRMTDDEEVTDGFDFGPDMIKKFRDGYIVDANGDPIWDSSIDDYKQGILHSDIYSMLGYEYLAANSMPFNTTSTTVVPVGIRLKKAGLYTISLPDGAHGVGITLVDNTTGERTNLSAGLEYQFDAEAGQNDNRFLLEIAPIKQVPTDIDVINGENGKDGARKVLIDGVLYIIRDGKVYDARGNKVE